jgi:hypothetical protein
MSEISNENTPHCPRCGSTEIDTPPIRQGLERWFSLNMILLIMGISAPDPGLPHHRCRACKEWWMEKGHAG